MPSVGTATTLSGAMDLLPTLGLAGGKQRAHKASTAQQAITEASSN
jgi:hypothetical protein